MFEITASSNRARVGVFAGLRTPCFFAHSRRGSPAHLTPDNALHCLPSTAVYHASLTDVLVPNAATIERAGGVHSFFNMGAHTMFLSQRDAAENRAFSGGEKTCSVTTSRGVQQVTPASFIKLCDSLRPDFVQLISDEVTPDATSNRCRKSAERTLNWANECLRLNTDTKRAFFFSIQGGGSVQSRNWLCQQASSKPVQGFAIGGLGLGESAEVRHNIVDSVLGQLPADKPRFLHGCGQPGASFHFQTFFSSMNVCIYICSMN
jgi:tRNA-guanine family transglycosylase